MLEDEDTRDQPGHEEARQKPHFFPVKYYRFAIMARKNPHIGSSFESWLEETGIREEVTAAAITPVIARQLASKMKKVLSPR